CFIFSCRLIAAAASWAFLTESACLPASCSALASLAKATAFLEASSVLPAVASVICLIRVGHWLASAGPASRLTMARAITRFLIQFTSFRAEGRSHTGREVIARPFEDLRSAGSRAAVAGLSQRTHARAPRSGGPIPVRGVCRLVIRGASIAALNYER